MLSNINIERWMKEALKEANSALSFKEVPIGSVVVYNNQVVGRGFNQVERLQDSTAHAEMIAIKSASNTLGSRRLNGTTIFITKEPCAMCAGAIVNSRIDHIVFGMYDQDAGACSSIYQLCKEPRFNHQVKSIHGGVMSNECEYLIKDFFKKKRQIN
tara:strand:- start:45 stop:515 length:471 start_codon:yes stop_codon:yes gene_type:complete